MDNKIYEYIMSNFKFYNKSNKWGCPNFSKDLTQSEVEEFLSSAKDILSSQKQIVDEVCKVPELDISYKTPINDLINCLKDLPQYTEVFVDEEGSLFYIENREETERELLERNMESFISFVNKKLKEKEEAQKVKDAITVIQDILKEYPEIREYLKNKK